MTGTHLREIWSYNLDTFRSQPLAEISGSLGDLGTFLPIVIALTEGNQITLSTTLILTGLYNVITGVLFGIPLPVQPMKAIAAVALLKYLSAGEVAAAGIFVSACILILSISGLLEWITNVTPIPVVKGIQVGAGLSLVIAAGTKATSSLAWIGPSWSDNYLWLIAVFVALVLTSLTPRTPFALLILILGLVFSASIILSGNTERLPSPALWHPHAQVPSFPSWRTGILSAGLGQLPLTTLNSIIAVTHLASTLMPDRPTPSSTAIGLSVASMNLIGCWFGAMPACHGSGGLAAQYRFGARSGGSVIFLGVLKIMLGLVFGNSLAGLLTKFPTSFLTVMIIAAGLELASVGESLNTDGAQDVKQRKEARRADASADSAKPALTSEEKKQRWTVMLVTAGVLVAFKNDGIGFVAGLLCHWSYHLDAKLKPRRAQLEAFDNERQPLLP